MITTKSFEEIVENAPNVRLNTERLVVRTLGVEAAERVAQYLLDNRLHFHEASSVKSEEFFTAEVQRQRLAQESVRMADGSFLRLWVVNASDEAGEIIGDVSLSNILRGSFLSCFLGYNLSAAHLGRGYMTEALHAAIEHSFGTMGLHRLEANIMPRNLPSIRLVERLGFRCEGVSHRLLKVNGAWEDHLRYVLLNADLETPAKPDDGAELRQSR